MFKRGKLGKIILYVSIEKGKIMKSVDKTKLFEEQSVPSAVTALCVPTIIASLVTVLYNLADTYFVGKLNDPVQTAAVTLAASVMLVFYAVNNLFGIGASSLMARSLGAKDYKTLKQASAFGFWGAVAGALLISICVAVFQNPLLHLIGADGATIEATRTYIRWTVMFGALPGILNVVMGHLVRSEGATFHAGIGTMSGCILNIILDPIFIHGFHMGAEGAALATFISNCVALLYFMGYLVLKGKSTVVNINPLSLKGINGYVIKQVLIVGVPAAIQNLLNVLGTTIFNNLASVYGAAALAAMGICQRIAQIPMFVAMGGSQGVMPLVSYSYGAKKKERMRETIYFSRKLMVIFLFSIAACMFLFPRTAVGLFMKEPKTLEYGTKLLRGFSIAVPFLGLDFLGVGVYQAIGKGQYALGFAIARKLILEIPLMWILDMVYPLYGLSFSQAIAEFVLAVASTILIGKIVKEE